MRNIISALSVSILMGCVAIGGESSREYTQWVDPTIGSGGHGHVFVGANVPHGMIQLGPVNISEGWDWCSGYHQTDTTIIGFAHTRLSGTGIGDKGDVMLMPVVGVSVFNKKADFLSPFSHNSEVLEAGYYSVELQKYGVRAQMTASERVGFSKYIYPQGTAAPQVILNLKQGIGWDWPTDVEAVRVGDSMIVGKRLSKGWADDDRVFFAMKFSKPILSVGIMADTTYNPHSKTAKVIVPGSYMLLTFPACDTIDVAVSVSGVDEQGALRNLDKEGVVGFDRARLAANKRWNDYLSVVEVSGGTAEQMKTFYTALYHTAFAPQVFSDVDGRYRGADGKIYKSKRPIYTVFSLWDTYRAAHPLYTLTEGDRVSDYVNSMLAIYDQQGKLPVWHLWGNETDCMVGFGSVTVVADAILKGVKGFDYKRAYEAMRSYAALNERGLGAVRDKGYIAADEEGESVAKALEYCISDYAVAQVAKKLGYKDDYEVFMERSRNYRRYFDPSDRFMKGLFDDGSRRTPFDPAHSTHREDDFCEGNSWQYSWLVPHDFEGLIALFPSKEAAEAKLDSLFTTPFEPNEATSPDISGMIGQYAHGNEPSHSTIYAYQAMGKPHKSAKLARGIMDSLYRADPDGLSGNEDCGQMSAWYVLNAMGLYQPNPAGGDFVIGSPLFEKMTLNLANGKQFTVLARGYSPQKTYHVRAMLNGKPYDKDVISYADIIRGGVLELFADNY